jgi:AcrR family transcriptional regulator
LSRTTTITDEQILEAAKAVFLEEGFGAQTSKIAKRAGVSEGSIFKRFPTKEALFLASLSIDESPRWRRTLNDLEDEWRGREGLADLLEAIMEFFSEIVPQFMAVMGSHGSRTIGSLFQGLSEDPPTRDLRAMTEFLQNQVDKRNIGNVDPGRTAHIILGTLIHYEFQEARKGKSLDPKEFRSIAVGTLDVLWAGLAPK